MPFPATWPPRGASGTRSIRFYKTGTTTALFSDNGYIFADTTSANPYVALPFVPPGGERVTAAIGSPPIGGGRDAHDANSDPAAGVIAPPPPTMIWCRAIIIHNDSANAIEISFDGVNVHGFIPGGVTVVRTYFDRFEAGIALRGFGGVGGFKVEAW